MSCASSSNGVIDACFAAIDLITRVETVTAAAEADRESRQRSPVRIGEASADRVAIETSHSRRTMCGHFLRSGVSQSFGSTPIA